MNSIDTRRLLVACEAMNTERLSAEQAAIAPLEFSNAYKAGVSPQAAWPFKHGGKTGWPPGMLQDDSRELSRALASKPDARLQVREACQSINNQTKE